MYFCDFLTYILLEVSSISARKLKCLGSARNLHSLARLESENSSLGSSLLSSCIVCISHFCFSFRYITVIATDHLISVLQRKFSKNWENSSNH